MAVLVAVVVIAGGAACGGDSKPRLEVSGAMTAAIAAAALGSDATVDLRPDNTGFDDTGFDDTGFDDTGFDDTVLADLAPIPFGEGTQWVTPILATAGSPAVGAPDPAIWLDPDRVVQAAGLLAARVELSEEARRRVDSRIDTLRSSMNAADEQVQSIRATLPAEPPTVVTANPRLGYFAERYGFRVQQADTAGARDDLEGLDTDRLGPTGSATASLDGLIVEVARRVAAGVG